MWVTKVLPVALLFLQFLLLPELLPIASAQIDTTEYAALRVIRNALDDLPGSTFFATWDFTLDPCSSFRGVVCSSGDHAGDSTQHVVMLSMGSGFAGSPGLSGHLSPALGSLPYLRILTLVPGSVRGSIPPQIGALSRLEFLGISKNGLSGSIPESFKSLASLRGLDLSNNKLTGSIPASIFALPSLATLILSSNDLSGSLPGAIAAPLQRLSADRNRISGNLPSALPAATLAHLDLSWNALEGSIASTALLGQIAFLDLSSNRLSGAIPSSLLTLPELAELLLQRNLLGGSVDPQGPVRITRLDLSHNALTGSLSPFLATVKSLLLNNNKLSGGVPRELIQGLAAGDVENLYLQHNFLSAIQAMEVMPQLLPASSVFCIQYNCLEPPAQSSCPASTGKEPSRPGFQCDDLDGDWD
ncbi:hypothetical protein SELMODRAFT_444337 [Selaginella moellendorffii]|uniref:Leucine-rich repeat-containing N-terminal plant-type domain-containing protein n=1 Tax=Selaginella moellendorffii TaxID=88036 RepID=D8S951_SELML|nr:LRR receptor-like serine/threonine-protein kinase ERECTA [Selaginella moellendorffii]EFJ19142.1 hypothetical protein SELMODRAFT_444337 [Selaginella moellendorffii]|eukprot:XP_002979740.1 LRR receptor-like serine/threonine-protein kinase ERECTA [Selaginella moellendorffii]